MLKKLRRRFTGLSMLMVSVVLVVFYIFTTAIIYFQITSGVQDALKTYASESYFFKYFKIGAEENSIDTYVIDSSSVCVVSVNENGGITYLDAGHAYIERGALSKVVEYVLEDNYDFGLIMHYNLFYYKNPTAFGYRIAFADAVNYFRYVKNIIIYDSIIFFFALVVLFLIIKKLSSIFVKPVEKAWNQQQNFIADASHELKTPLTVILANCNILQAHRGDTVDGQIKWIDSTGEEATHMKELVDKMLVLAKAENQKQATPFSDVNLTELVTRLALQFEPVAYENGVTLETLLDEDTHVFAEPTAMNQIIHILIDNAVKYAGLGGQVFVRLEKKQNYVFLSAKNTGAPIPPEDIPHIFERFYRSDKARTSGGGYGLGLAICKTLVEQQKGSITFTSDEVNGTEFTVKFKKKK